jgi:hypothetical protein
MLRLRKSQKARSSCSSIDITVHEDLQSPSSLLDESLDIETLSKLRALAAQPKTRQSYAINTSQATKGDLQQRQYCTQACLLGLTQRRPLNEACPNFFSHRGLGAGSYYVLD